MNTETTSSGVTTIDVNRPLDEGEATELARCEEVIERGVGGGSRRRVMGTRFATRWVMRFAAFVMITYIGRRIRSFGRYCRDKWDITGGRAHKMIAALAAENPSPTEDEPVSEDQIHPLALLPPDEVSPTPTGEQGRTTEEPKTHQLRADEAAALEQHEAVIERGIATFCDMAAAFQGHPRPTLV